ncbi:hypothetical protein, partial [Seonamhaeicola sp.]|uniref:hypothetical protein n=1 Tax=Seonamhaeicola sp. TaxID=1912245 RepID=UPI0035623B55
MNKFYKTLVVLLLVSGVTFAQSTKNLKEYALRDANIVSAATLKYDFETIFKYTLPSVIDMMGGKEKGIELIESTFDKMKT